MGHGGRTGPDEDLLRSRPQEWFDGHGSWFSTIYGRKNEEGGADGCGGEKEERTRR